MDGGVDVSFAAGNSLSDTGGACVHSDAMNAERSDAILFTPMRGALDERSASVLFRERFSIFLIGFSLRVEAGFEPNMRRLL